MNNVALLVVLLVLFVQLFKLSKEKINYVREGAKTDHLDISANVGKITP